jgi:lysophospholipase L1-like esterase
MLECLIIGDSIAVGVAQQRPECVSYSTGGLNTWQWNKKYSDKVLASPVVIISLGSNDHKYINTEVELLKMREKVQSQRVFWVLPAGNLKASEVNIQWIQGLVREIAGKYGDVVLPITRLQRDGIHPSWAGYKELANQTR